MGKATIIEAQNSKTVYEEGKSSGILGKLKGIFADYRNGTRNADRLYTEELWDNRVFGSEDVMEALQTKTLFGELDHPEGDRCETLAKNAAITITKLEKRPEEGVIYGEAEILDTPTGRIVKALADSGAKLGISSRGMGEEIYQNGQNIIDPDTYDFITFDVVVTPANTKARVSLTESKQYKNRVEELLDLLDAINLKGKQQKFLDYTGISKAQLDGSDKFNEKEAPGFIKKIKEFLKDNEMELTESFKKEIAECETENQLNQIKTILESVSANNKDELVNLTETKLDNLKNKEVKTTKLDEANKAIAIKLLKNKLAKSNTQLAESLKANESLSAENTKLVEEKAFLENSRNMLKSKISENKVNDLALKEASRKIAKLEEQLSKETSAHKETLLKVNTIHAKKIENMEVTHKEEVTKLNESLQAKTNAVTKLMEANKQLTEKVEAGCKILEENKALQAKIKMLEAKQLESNKKLTESKTAQSNRIAELEAQVKSLTENKSKMEEAQNRFSKLAFNPIGTVKAVAENFERGSMSQDEIDLFNALTGN